MTLSELLSHLRRNNCTLWVDGDRLRYRAAGTVMTPDVLAEIRTHKADIIAYLGDMDDQATSSVHASRIPPRANDGPAPLSYAQQGLWYLDQLNSNSSVYNEATSFRLRGSLDIGVLKRSLNEIVRRHEALRTNFRVKDGKAIQFIRPATVVEIPVVELDHLPAPERQLSQQKFLETEASRPFDLAEDLLVRAAVLRLQPDEHVLFFMSHHIVFDGWSGSVFQRELIALYELFRAGEPAPLGDLEIQYADYAVWQQEWLQGAELDRQLAYWEQCLSGELPVLEMPADKPRPAIMRHRGARQVLELPHELSVSLTELARSEGATLFMALLAAFKTLLFRYTGQEDVIVASPIANRTHPEIEGLIGHVMNMLVLRTSLGSEPTFRELLRRVRDVCLGAYSHSAAPFARLVEKLNPKRNLSHTPLFQAIFGFQDWTDRPRMMSDIALGPMTVLDPSTAETDLSLHIQDVGNKLIGWWEYRTDLFEPFTISRMTGHLQSLLQGILADPNQRISELPLLTEGERHQLLVEWNETEADYPQDSCIHHLFEAQVERSPEAIALVFENDQLTYRELNHRANQLAHHLQKLRVKPEAPVGICIERSLEMVIGLLGILKAGGVYVPLDPEYPKQRLSFMLEDTSASVLLTQSTLRGHLPDYAGDVVCLDTDWPVIAKQDTDKPATQMTCDNLAYVIYTSGSTGTPKGVQNSQRAVVNFLSSMRRQPGLTEQDVMLAVTTLSFDIALLELLLPISVGARVVVVAREVASDGKQLQEKLATSGATVMQATPATWRLLLETGWQGNKQLKILCGGEALPLDLANQLRERCASLWNQYGPTEATVWSTMHRVDAGEGSVSIGRPIANTQVYVLDAQLQPVPIGVAGELHIGGEGLARGYLNRPELTAEKFIANPFSEAPQARLYKTGDLARYLPDGAIECLGRLDHQVKIRGFRIELGEIEAVLAEYPTVAETVVIAREDTPGDKRLVVYLIASQEPVPSISELRSFLKKKLPDYMVPSAFVFLEALPLTPNGKVDRKALPAPDQGRPELGTILVAPRDAIEVQLTKIWEKVLGHEPIGVRDNFFELGGHSLLAVQLVHQIGKVFGKTLPVIALFQAPTVEQLAEALREEDPSRAWTSVVPLQPNGSKPPFFFLAGRSHFGDRLGPDQPVYRVVYQDLDREQPLVRIEDMAAHSIKSVRTIQPDGPYCLGGHGVGGLVAFEIAHQLQRQGQKVALLALCEASLLGSRPSTPGTSSAYRLWQRASYYFLRARRLGPRQALAALLRSLKKKTQRATWREQTDPRTRSRQGHRAAAYEALRHYVPQAYAGRITVIRCAERVPWKDDDPLYGWGRLATDGVEAYEIPGSHTGIYREPNVGVLARTLNDVLHKAQARAESERMALADLSVSAEPITSDDVDRAVATRVDLHASWLGADH